MVIVCKIQGDRFNGHFPFVHSVPSAPPKAQSALRPFGGLYLVQLGTGAVCFLAGDLPNIPHARKEYHKTLFIRADIGVIRQKNMECLLLAEHPCGIAGSGLGRAKEKEACGHEVERKNVKLDANPEHQRDAEYSTQHSTQGLFCQQQTCCRQIGQTVDDQQCPA